MSNKIEPFKINGATVFVEVSEIGTGISRSNRAKIENTATSAEYFADEITKVELSDTLSAIVGPVHEAFKAAKPAEVSVELCLGFKGEVGVFVAKSEGSAALKITAKWTFE
ncbi:MAG: hypothetical protein OEM00_08610 [Burkholderiaceae bacterium]|nr:hypothetical protein [Burkholderiaceae bacterium]MDH3461024.1 hypothetical protein [Burkholderiaceae bacterium]